MPIVGKVKHAHKCARPPAGALDADTVFLCSGPDGCGKQWAVKRNGGARDAWHTWVLYDGPVEYDMSVK